MSNTFKTTKDVRVTMYSSGVREPGNGRGNGVVIPGSMGRQSLRHLYRGLRQSHSALQARWLLWDLLFAVSSLEPASQQPEFVQSWTLQPA